MKIGLVGLSKSGKTTVFNALTGMQAEVDGYAGGKIEPNFAVLPVADPRVDRLTEIYRPKKTVYATVEFVDFVGLGEGAAKSDAFSSAHMAKIKTMDALAIVLRNFADQTGEGIKPLSDMRTIEEEMLLSDLLITEQRLERIELSIRRGQKTNALILEQKTLQKILEHLNDNRPVRTIGLTDIEEKSIRGFQFLTQKPWMVILNSEEDVFGKNSDIIDEIEKRYTLVEFAGNFEMELSRIEDTETIDMFMADMGIEKSARDRLVQTAYDILGYISFFTVGQDEVRAWQIRKGETAVEAAGTIHTDLAKGFIRAECFSFDDLEAYGSEKALKENGRFRLEGKQYAVSDGDILSIRFNV